MADVQLATNFIDGVWKSADNAESFTSRNPATGEMVGTCVMSKELDVTQAVQAANEAYQAWKKRPVPERADYLWKVAEILLQRKEHIAKMMTLEMGKVYAESLGEVDATIASCKYMAGEGRRMFGETIPTGSQDRMAMTVREPLGVVACITPWNFPIALAAYKIFAALVAGNTIVWKPASDVALSAKLFTEIFESAGLPDGVLNLILGTGSKVGNALAQHKDVKVIAFTGSTEVGIHLAEIGARTLKRISLELGGKNAVIVMEDADLDQAAAGIVKAAFTTTGQRCTAASRVIVVESVREELEQRIVALTEKLKVGNGLETGIDIGPLANASQLKTVETYVEIAKQEGGRLLTGGFALKEAAYQGGFYYAPTVVTNVRRDHRIAREEIFGPVLAIISVEHFEEAIEVNNDTEYGLSTSIYTNSLHYANRASRELEAGLVYINNGTSNAETGMAFGGVKMSGNGHREVSHHAFDCMTEWKTIYTNF
ncbi:aldehyde dehydrogenase family protein [Brevibacillus choshinensis]|uniref:Aldehyde dehydrogenase family protein n=1 Tax=Brevibacillus choshinensis TaxID=54911 RepID=A0ABX7FIQ9_BRECH|nr:aldehyde dehydrogenase family protein [Brevibacillus choshinensis]QRG65211.1 aldehyde dehydrogenase family protein [Brevibacillus choshinensis]